MPTTYKRRIAPVPKGTFSISLTYAVLDIVNHDGGAYICKTAVETPGAWNENNWQLLCTTGAKGDTGDTGAQGEQGPQGIQGEKGEKGDKGDPGEGFSIYKTYASIALMEADAANVDEGKFVLIASDVEDEDNAKLYVKGADSFTFLTDLSGAQGIKGETGAKGDTGDTGPQGEQGIAGTPAGFGTPTATATALAEGSSPTVSVAASGDNTAKVFTFTFGLPTGATGPQGNTGPKGDTGEAGEGITDISAVDENGEITITVG